jgi:hypothetical protein
VNDKSTRNLVPIAISSGICNANMVESGNSNYCIGPWGKNNWILITNNTGLEGFEKSINIYIVGLNQVACISLANTFATNADNLLYTRINEIENFRVGEKAKPPLTPIQVNTACSRAENNHLMLTYNLQ